jgi:hypothetical protein
MKLPFEKPREIVDFVSGWHNIYLLTRINNENDEIECNFSYCRDCVENFETDCCRFIGWRKYLI